LHSSIRLKRNRSKTTVKQAIPAVPEAAISDGHVCVDNPCPSHRLMADFVGLQVDTVNRAMRGATQPGGRTARTLRATTDIARASSFPDTNHCRRTGSDRNVTTKTNHLKR